ncbi:Uncharacterised protein [Serratia ficaria]|uniref:hypothetical protein n=1 Tax=Serratia ficaria TaxID=61651 RepID=UPI0021793428|nr:hypothetical protein [Serratia ficaria]CAI1205999.1 Uncharacterised protein [Serratia ficaria]CAI2009275.1 Uncharacterised protein [Serratia ficaria]CAI2534816.1 Uncharacterised protein [Serratia ficaria]
MISESDKARFNTRIGGEVLVWDYLDNNEGIVQIGADVEITESSLCERLSEYALLHGEDLQGMFKDEKYEYMSCFIRDVAGFKAKFENEEFLKPLFSHGKGETAEFLISFPEKHIQTTYDTVLEMVNEVIERHHEGQELREKGKDGICTWTEKDTGNAYRWLNGYVKALEDNALITDEQLESLQKKIISLSGWGAPKVQSDLRDIQSASELTANAIIDNCNVKVILGNGSKA